MVISRMNDMKLIDRWLIDAFRCATIKKDDRLELEVLFINFEKRKLFELKS